MRSKLGTKSRLAAHILALLLLIVLLVHGGPAAPEQPAQHKPLRPSLSLPPQDEAAAATPDAGPDLATAPIAAPDLANTAAPVAPVVADAPDSTQTAPVAEPDTVPDATAVVETTPETPVASDAAQSVDESALTDIPDSPVPGEQEMPVVDETNQLESGESAVPAVPAVPVVPVVPAEATESVQPSEAVVAPVEAEESNEPSAAQPDESGSLVVATPEDGPDAPIPVTTPLPENANLVVLGDGVYWLDSRYDLEKELAAIPEIGTLVFLAPLPHYHSQGFEHVQTEVIAADMADLSRDAAERYLHLVENRKHPVVTAVLPGARGAAFFKGAYLLTNSKLALTEVVRELEPELDEAGPAKDDIIHRLTRLTE